MSSQLRTLSAGLMALAVLGLVFPARAEWPDRPVTVVMPYRAGGGGETMVRLVMQQASQTTGQSFIVENRPGGGGTIGAGFVAKERPDGYTLLGSNLATMVIAPLFVHGWFRFNKGLHPHCAVRRSAAGFCGHRELSRRRLCSSTSIFPAVGPRALRTLHRATALTFT